MAPVVEGPQAITLFFHFVFEVPEAVTIQAELSCGTSGPMYNIGNQWYGWIGPWVNVIML
jgi:hypothetical protein